MSTEATKLKIINSALRMVGSYHIDASDTTSTTYEIANRAYEQAVTELFGDNIFNYNTKRSTLTGVSGSTEFKKFSHSYTLPADLNILLVVEDEDDYLCSDYRFANGLLYSDKASLRVTYTYVPDLSSATALPEFLTRVLTLHMAQNMAIELSGSENRHEILYVQYQKALKRARVLEGRQGPAQTYINEENSQFLGGHQNYGKV